MSFFRSLLMAAGKAESGPFTRLDYIESTGSQYIVLPYRFEPTDEVEVTGFLNNVNGLLPTDRAIVGTTPYNSPENTRFSMLMATWSSGRKLNVGFGASIGLFTPEISPVARQALTVTYANRIFTCGSSTVDVTNATFNGSSPPISLFKAIAGNLTHGGISHFHQLKANGNELNLIPVLWNAGAPYTDGNTGATVTPTAPKPGMYDKISGKLFVNQGVGEDFIYPALEPFTLTIQVAAGQTWSFTCHISTDEYLDILDWGDGASDTYVANGTASHTYASAGTYVVKMRGNVARAQFGVPNNPNANSEAVIDCNGNWTALGNITQLLYGFSCCTNFVGASLHSLPENLEDALSMFYGCTSMASILTALPATLASAESAFWNCTAAINLTRLPPGLVSAKRMFSDAVNLNADLDTLSANAPADGWTALTNISYMFTRCTGVTGSKSAFLAKCPNVTASDYWAYGTSTTE